MSSTQTTSSKISNFKLFSFLVKKRKKTTTNEQTDSPRSSNSDTDMMIDTSPRTTSNSTQPISKSTSYVDVNSSNLGALSETHVNPRNSARIIRRTDNEGFKNKVNNRKSAAFTKQQIVF